LSNSKTEGEAFEKFCSLAQEADRDAKEWYEKGFVHLADGRRVRRPTEEFVFRGRARLKQLGMRAATLIEEVLSDHEVPFETKGTMFTGISYSGSIALARLALRATVDDPSADVRWYALQTAFRIQARSFRQAFLEALRDPAPEVRKMAALYLSGFARSRHRALVADALIKIAMHPEEDETVRAAAASALARYRGRIVDRALENLADQPDNLLRREVETALKFREARGWRVPSSVSTETD
jgi:HEAT repeat protein